MNTLTQFSLISLFYLLVIVIAFLYDKYGKREALKKVLKEDVAPVSLMLLIAFNVVGLIMWLGEIL